MNSINLSVSSAEANELLAYYQQRKNDWIDANRQVFNKLREFDGMIAKLNAIIGANGSEYPKEGSWNQRVKYVLGKLQPGVGLTIRGIVDAIAEQEGVESGSDGWKDIYKGVAPSLSAGGKLYKKVVNDAGSNTYMLLK